MSNLLRRVSSRLGVSFALSNADGNPISNQTGEVINPGSESVQFPTKPDGWQSPESWIRFQELRAKYIQNFQDTDSYINTFLPAEVEMIMKWVDEESCFEFTDSTYTKTKLRKRIGDIHLFKKIAETRQTLYSTNKDSVTLEYINLDYALETMPPQHHYKYKFIGNDTIYKC